MEHKGTVRLETGRLILRPFTMEDAEPMYRNYASDPTVTVYLTWPTHRSPDVTRSVLAQWTSQYNDPAFYQWALELRSAGEVIGAISVVDRQKDVDALELGWCIGSRWWGQGLMPEAAAAVTRFLFEEAGALRVTARCDAENLRSARVMEKIGMRYEGTLRAHGRNNRGIVDEMCYGILRNEFGNREAPPCRPTQQEAQQREGG